MNKYRGDYEIYFVEYFGDIRKRLEPLNYAFLYEELPIYYVVLIEEGRFKDFIQEIPELISIQQNYIYKLSQIEESEYTLRDKCINMSSHYSGKGITVGVIGAGIDYLNQYFVNDEGHSRIKAVWDQTIELESRDDSFYGKVFEKYEIEQAIQLHINGENPLDKVDHIDGGGYGTTICKAIGGSRFNSINSCEFAIVKLKRAEIITRNINCIKFRNGSLYETYDIVKALQYLAELNKVSEGPMVVYMPVESNSGGRNGTSVLERYINYYSSIYNDFFIITNNGNEGDGYRHSDGIITNGEVLYVPIVVGKEINEDRDERREEFQVSLWTNIYDKISFKILSPLEEETITLDTKRFNQVTECNLNEAKIEIIFMTLNLKSEEKEIIIRFRNAVQGTWIISFEGKEIIYGEYDMWLPMKELTNYNVNFKYPCRFRTLTTPATAARALTTMCYSQYERDIRILSGKPSDDIKKRTQESFIVDSTGMLIEDEYGIIKIDGVAVAGCILCWMVVLILQWAIIEGNKPNIDLKGVKQMLSRGAIKHFSNRYSIVDINKLNDLLVEL